MSEQVYTVVVWNEGDRYAREVGPTATECVLLADTLCRARALSHDAEIIEWERRGCPVQAILAARAKRESRSDET